MSSPISSTNQITNNENENQFSTSFSEQKSPYTTVSMDILKEKEAFQEEIDIIIDDLPIQESNLEATAPTQDNAVNLNVGKEIGIRKKARLIYGYRNISLKNRIMQAYGMSGLSPPQVPQAQQEQQQQPPRSTAHTYPPMQPQPQQGMWLSWSAGQGQQYGNETMDPPLVYDPKERNNFVVKVMALVMIMLILTASFLAYVLSTKHVKTYFGTSGFWLIIPAFIGLMMCDYAMICFPCGRRPPTSILVLLVTTVSMSMIAAVITSHYRTEIVLYATICTSAVVFVCLLLACTKFDFTSWILYVVIFGVVLSAVFLVVFGVVLITGVFMKPVIICLLLIGTLLQSVMLTIQLQMILGGKRVEISEDDYSIAAFMLYTSILSIFIHLVQILGLADA